MSNRKKNEQGGGRRRTLPDALEGIGEPARPWKIRFSKSVRETDLHTLSTPAIEAARKAIDKKLKVDPVQYGEFLHRPLQGFYKLKTSAVRIVYHVETETHEVWIFAMGDRRDIWKDETAILKRWDAARGEFRPDDVGVRPQLGQR